MIHTWASTSTWAQAQRDAVDIWLLGGLTEQQMKSQLTAEAERKIERIQTVCSLNADQLNKLQMVAKGEVARVFYDIVTLRQATAGLNMNNQNDMQKAAQLVMPARTRLQAGLDEDGSLFSKVLVQVLSAQQSAAYEEQKRLELKQLHHALVLSTVADLDQRLGLVKEQREKLVELMDGQSLEMQMTKKIPRSYGMYIGYLKLLRIPDSELSKFMDAQQLNIVNKVCEQYRNIEMAIR